MIDEALPARRGSHESPAAVEMPLVFTGVGGEYFRIWVVNTVLTIVTVGIYSAWAKVRKASYFARNTCLLGDGFEFTANPWAILGGRLLALALIAFYSLAFDFSLTLGLVATATLVTLAPLLYASALRFRLKNTRWRAIRFDFTATRRDAYRAVLVVVAVWLSTNVVVALGEERSVGALTAISLLLLPWMHHRLKAFQHGHAAFAGYRSRFCPGLGAFYGTYVLAAALLIGAAGAVFAVLLVPPLFGIRFFAAFESLGAVVAGLSAALAYLAAWPYFATRIQRTVWERTTIGPFAFKTSIAFRTLLPIATKNLALLVVTAGLYWPFASIAWARYRIGCISVVGSEAAVAAIATLDTGAATPTVGEGAVDFFGIDIGW